MRAVSLLDAAGIRRMLTEAVRNFTAFPPLGLVLVMVVGVGLCERAGLFAALLRAGVSRVPAISSGCAMSLPNSDSTTEPSMIMPLPKSSCACAIVLFGPGTTRCFRNPNALHNHSIAAGALR